MPTFTRVEQILKTFPEVRTVYSKTGRPEIANDVMGVHQTDVWTLLKPQDEWRPGLTRDALIRADGPGALRERPGGQVRLQPADRDADQRAGGGGQERRGRPALRPRPRRAPPEGGRDRARPGAAARGEGRPVADLGPAADAPHLGPARPAGPVRDPCGRRARRGRRPGGDDRRHRLRGAGPPRHPGPPARVLARRPRADPLDPRSSIPRAARSRCATWPTSRSRKARARSSARTCSAARWSGSTSGAATSPASSPRRRRRSRPG